MASMEEIIGQLNHAINELERNAAGLAYQTYEPLAQSIHALNGVPAGEQAMQEYQGLIAAIQQAWAAEQQLKQTLEGARATFHG